MDLELSSISSSDSSYDYHAVSDDDSSKQLLGHAMADSSRSPLVLHEQMPSLLDIAH